MGAFAWKLEFKMGETNLVYAVPQARLWLLPAVFCAVVALLFQLPYWLYCDSLLAMNGTVPELPLRLDRYMLLALPLVGISIFIAVRGKRILALPNSHHNNRMRSKNLLFGIAIVSSMALAAMGIRFLHQYVYLYPEIRRKVWVIDNMVESRNIEKDFREFVLKHKRFPVDLAEFSGLTEFSETKDIKFYLFERRAIFVGGQSPAFAWDYYGTGLGAELGPAARQIILLVRQEEVEGTRLAYYADGHTQWIPVKRIEQAIAESERVKRHVITTKAKVQGEFKLIDNDLRKGSTKISAERRSQSNFAAPVRLAATVQLLTAQ